MKTSMPEIEVTSSFWTHRRDLVRDSVLPYQWDVLTDAIPIKFPVDPAGNREIEARSGAIENLKVAAGDLEGDFTGFPYEDSDVYKWLEAVAYALMAGDEGASPELHHHADEVVNLIAAAQMDDGYLDSYYQINGIDRRFTLLQQSHELYVMGHYIEAGIAYHEATGNETALGIARRMADCIDANFGPEEGKIHGSDGHPEIELALARLYEATGERRYLDLAHWFIVTRGTDPEFFERQCEKLGGEVLFETMRSLPRHYYQADRPYLEQTEVRGHAVRALYLLCAASQVARLSDDGELAGLARRLWDNVVNRRMYITGGLGSTQRGEAFTYDYDLPNDTMYGETCASVAMAFLARQMLAADADGTYGDVLERELFNGSISGMALDGKHFYYVNPLEADPRASEGSPDKRHVLTRRAEWFPTPCCPANLARLIASIDRYIYCDRGDGCVLVDQYIASRAEFSCGLAIEIAGNYPWDGDIGVEVENGSSHRVRIGLRIPAWSADNFSLVVNGEARDVAVERGFAYLDVPAGSHLSISLVLDVSPRCVRASNRVRSDAGLVAVSRGPIVYCMETADNVGDLWTYRLDPETLSATYEPGLLDGVAVVHARGVRAIEDAESAGLYIPAGTQRWEEAELTFIPYYAWANREDGQMRVWVRPTDVRWC